MPVALDREAEQTLHEQVERQLREAIQAGRIAPGAPLPSTRGLAAELGVSRGVVSEAYGQLAAQGYLACARARRCGSRRRSNASARANRRARCFPRFAYDLAPGRPTWPASRADAWLRSVRAAWRAAPFDA